MYLFRVLLNDDNYDDEQEVINYFSLNENLFTEKFCSKILFILITFSWNV